MRIVLDESPNDDFSQKAISYLAKTTAKTAAINAAALVTILAIGFVKAKTDERKNNKISE